MAITTILIDDKNKTISVERAAEEDFSKMEFRAIKPAGEKGWLIAIILEKQMKELIGLTLAELQDKHLKQMREST